MDVWIAPVAGLWRWPQPTAMRSAELDAPLQIPRSSSVIANWFQEHQNDGA